MRGSVRMEGLEERLWLSGGALDGSFANGTTPVLATGRDTAYAVAALPNGGFLLSGKSSGAKDDGVGVARFGSDGMIDPTFGRNGQTFLPYATDTGPLAMAAGADGKVIVAGSGPGAIWVVRLTADGNVDQSFAGQPMRVGSGVQTISRMIVRPNGRVLMAVAWTGRSA